jgi:hypothetical protein
VGVEEASIISTKSSVEEGVVETLNIQCASSQEFANKPGASATGYFVAISKHL